MATLICTSYWPSATGKVHACYIYMYMHVVTCMCVSVEGIPVHGYQTEKGLC